MTTQRLNAYALAPAAFAAKQTLDDYMVGVLDPGLNHLIKFRVSQINHCAYCLHMHREEALRDGESEKRLLLLDACQNRSYSRPRRRPRWPGRKA